jgi:probable phosphoglycerate mutase
MAIYLLRHGETPGNAGRVVQTPDTPLSERGRDQAARAAARLVGAGIARILTSDLARAALTAEALRRALQVPVEEEPLLRERDFGEIRGTPYAELTVDIFGLDYAPPGGETWPAFHDRVDRAWGRVQEVAAATTGHLAVVTHGLVCFSLATRHLALPAAAEPGRGFRNASVTRVEGAPPHRVSLHDCTAHLEDAEPDGGGAGRV